MTALTARKANALAKVANAWRVAIEVTDADGNRAKITPEDFPDIPTVHSPKQVDDKSKEVVL